MLQRAVERGHLKARWVAGDDAFGMLSSFRDGLAALGMLYVLDVPAGFTWCGRRSLSGPIQPTRVGARPANPSWWGGQRRTMTGRSDELPEDAWRELMVAQRSQGLRV